MKERWWGYKHISGSYQAKPFWDQRDLDDAYKSGFCRYVVEPFYAIDRESALLHIEGVTNAMEWAQMDGEHHIIEMHRVHHRGPGTMKLLRFASQGAHGKLTIRDGSDVLFEYEILPSQQPTVYQVNLNFGDELNSTFRGVGNPHYDIDLIPRAY